jgi:hypothetical protein
MLKAAKQSQSLSLHTRLEQAVQQLDQKIGCLDEWMARTSADLDDFQMRWQASSENIAAQLIEQPTRPQLQIFQATAGCIGVRA